MAIRKHLELIEGIGLNDANYPIRESITHNRKTIETWKCPYYAKWKLMLKRCYNKKELNRNPTYQGCEVCEEWLIFSTFRSWMETQDWEGKELDKDLLFENNKIYSPSTCVFISHNLNTFLAVERQKGDCPLGVHLSKTGRYITQCSRKLTTTSRWVGTYLTEQDAHKAWKFAKLKELLAFKEIEEDPKVLSGLARIESKLKVSLEENTEIFKL